MLCALEGLADQVAARTASTSSEPIRSTGLSPMRSSAGASTRRQLCSEPPPGFQFGRCRSSTASTASAKVGTLRGGVPLRILGSRPSSAALRFSSARSRAIAKVTTG